MQSKYDVVVVGSYNQDMIWTVEDFPIPGQTVRGKFKTGPGGKGSNQAIAAHKAGAATLFIGAIGTDVFGQYAQDFYAQLEMSAHWIVKPHAPTGNAAIIVNHTGQNEIIGSRGANYELSTSDIPIEQLEQAKILVCQIETKLAVVSDILRAAKKSGLITILNPAPAPKEDFLEDFYSNIDILTPNETEFCALLTYRGCTALNPSELYLLGNDRLKELCAKIPCPRCIITLGDQGCFVKDGIESYKIKAYTNIHVVDTTGAGDAFTGALAAELSRGSNLREATIFANAAAALSTTQEGAATSMHSRTQIEAFLKQNSPQFA